ncbi:DUF4294 domain-containing protein [Compostibacter hankyongensis]|uniref:DUF4294 domain-containing protein n=1 Tax=Compostibacter hankyongensis TaxID=1007089 RepID=A0ABP8FNR9_9BACT
MARLFVTIILLGCFCMAFEPAEAQRAATDSIPVSVIVEGGDSMLAATLPGVLIFDRLPRRWRQRQREWSRLRNAVYVTYPYAKAAASVLKDVDTHLATIHGKKERRAYLKEKEKELKAQFGSKLEDLSVYQGKVLIKLIYRETGDNCYNLIRELKGGFSARVWQTVAFFFGSNLKTPYDRQQDSDIENIVREMQTDPYFYYFGRYN